MRLKVEGDLVEDETETEHDDSGVEWNKTKMIKKKNKKRTKKTEKKQ